MVTALDRVQYSVSQSSRVAWYFSHYLMTQRMSGPVTPPGEPVFRASQKPPAPGALMRALAELFDQDWRNIEAGIYAKPHDMMPDPRRLFENSRRFLSDVPKVDERRLNRSNAEVFRTEFSDLYPRYYLQNFHYQTDGWLSEQSAKLYDTQVEVLFTGAADAMRRQALVPLAAALKGQDQRTLRLLDVASGTARFLTFVKDNYPRLPVTALDLSAYYLEEAKRNLKFWGRTDFVQSNAESMPYEDGAFDLVSSIFLFHELPPKIRRVVAKEIARVVAPGGTFILVDSLQYGDEDGWDGVLEFFPVAFHEPYYLSYLSEDFPEIFAEAGLVFQSATTAFLSKVSVFHKPV